MTWPKFWAKLKSFEPNLLKIDRKSNKNIAIYNIGYITIKKIDNYENTYSVNPLYLLVNHANGYIVEKNENKYLIFDSTDENKSYWRNTQMFGVELKTKSKQQIVASVIMKKITRKLNLILMMTYH